MNNTSTCFHDPVDEILEMVWTIEERGEEATAERIMSGERRDLINADLLAKVTAAGLLQRRGDAYEFTASGRSRGEDIIRRHRLAERLLVDVLNMQMISVEASACCFEHFLSPEVTDRICTLLGHPAECPHGLPIPRGPCCTRAEKQVETVVVPLGELKSGESGRITYISTSDHHRLDRLTSLGLFPGRVVRVHQREPLFVVLLGETQLALDKEIVAEVYVLKS
jgi:DtxR family Mn-dependent transcriptional regulator